MKRQLMTLLAGVAALSPALAQRQTDALDRGLVAVKTGNNIFCSWRLQADEYYDVTYNIYRDGVKLNSEPLTTSNYMDKSGSTSSSYTVEPVVRGVAQAKSAAVTPWAQNYLEITMDHGSLKSNYVPNDACCADVDGDGQLEILLKFDNTNDNGSAKGNDGEYEIIEVYKLNGKKLWWIECGPNIGDFQNNELNVVAFDWDQDGKAEAVLRLADGSVIHKADGTTTTIGDASVNVRQSGAQSGQWFVYKGAEYLVYLNGETGEVFDQMTYPLKRLENGETDLEKAWGDGYGHRATKHFFGAPFLDGKKPSIFLARGIYTRHKMIALDVNPASHKLTTRWSWNSNTSGIWYGQGYHNYGIADVDMDGRDEICYGSMVIDDNGKGLSSSGLGHGDSQHHGDLDPYSWGLEIFACNEDKPWNNFRDLTTSKIYYRATGSGDDGRAVAGNFFDEYPGAQCLSAKDPNLIGGASHKAISGASTKGVATNFRIYWDGDLLDETFNYVNGKNTAGGIYKPGYGLLATLEGSLTNNDTKGTPCYQGDLFGDWREEVIMRTAEGNIRIYTTNIATEYRNYSLWYDHQYRNAMVWQMCGYNQTPHVSYFVGKLEGITMAPPPLTLAGRTEIEAGSTIGSSLNDKHILLDEIGDATVSVADGASPYIFTDNAPSWTQGAGNNDKITTTYYTHTLTGGAFTGKMRLVKQGEGTLVLPNVVETYTGETNIWNGKLQFDGTLQNSRLWLNRHTALQTTGGKFLKGIQAEYNATIHIGSDEAVGTLEADSLILGFGSRLELDLFGGTLTADQIKVKTLKIEKKDWQNGPAYLKPVIQFVRHYAEGDSVLTPGRYLLGEVAAVDGSLEDFIIEGLGAQGAKFSLEDGKLYVKVSGISDAEITWTGSTDGTWDLDNSANFVNNESQQPTTFISGNKVIVDDNANTTAITVKGNLWPESLTFNNNTKSFTLTGDSLAGGFTLTKNGKADVAINNVNHIGKTVINGGRLKVATLANNTGRDYGALGSVNDSILIDNGTLYPTSSITTTQIVKIGQSDSATFEVPSGMSLIMGTGIKATHGGKAILTKAGSGSMTLAANNNLGKLLIKAGSVTPTEVSSNPSLPTTIEFVNGTLNDPNTEGSYSTNSANFVVPALCNGTVHSDPRSNYKGTLTGGGTFTFYAGGSRVYLQGDWSKFEGTLVPATEKRGTYDGWFLFDNNYGLPNATLKLNSGVQFNNNGQSVVIGKLTGTGTLAGSGSYILGSNGDDFTYSTPCTSPLIKRGAGKMTATKMGVLTGNLSVEDGTFQCTVLSLSTKFNGSGSITLKNTSKMLDQCYAQTILAQGTSQVCLYNAAVTTPRTVKTDAAFTASGNSTVNFLIKSKSSYSKLTIGTYLSLAYVNIQLATDYVPADGDEFTLWTSTKLNSFDLSKVTLPTLPTGYYWDTTDLANAKGILRIAVDPAGIDGMSADQSADYKVYTTAGVYVGTVTATKSELKTAVRDLGLQSGTYVVKNGKTTEKVLVK